MTAHELARILLLGPDIEVTVRGYEGGVNTVTTVEGSKLLHKNVHTEWYYGAHEYCYGAPCDRCELTLNGKPINSVESIHLGYDGSDHPASYDSGK